MSSEASPVAARAPSPAAWRAAVAPYIGPDATRSILQLVTTLGLLALSFTVAKFGGASFACTSLRRTAM